MTIDLSLLNGLDILLTLKTNFDSNLTRPKIYIVVEFYTQVLRNSAITQHGNSCFNMLQQIPVILVENLP